MRTATTLLLLAALACGDDDAPTPDAGLDASSPDATSPDAMPGADAGPPGDAGPPPIEGPTALTEGGALVGALEDGVRVWRGIPYAAPPVGELRFRPPRPHPGWEGWREATANGPICPQRERDGTAPVGEEDCLTLQVFAPASEGPHPVMVWIHGGGFVQGAGSLPLYDGHALVQRGDVVVVTLNYRVGALGFLASEELVAESEAGVAGNMGLRDQVLALEWVRRNIGAFGGDPDAVTIFGESAGGVSVCALLGAPAAEGLFDRAIVQSGGGCYGWPLLDGTTLTEPVSALERGAEITAAAGCADEADPLACLRALDAEALVEATWMASSSGLGLPDVGPTVDGDLLPAETWDRFGDGSAPDKPILIGSNADEAKTFVAAVPVPTAMAYEDLVRRTVPLFADELLALYPASDFASPKAAYEALYSDLAFICPANAFAAQAAGGSAPSRAYHFTHTLTGAAALGAFHGLEIFYVFDNLAELPRYTPVPADAALVTTMQDAWLAFARGEDPAGWPAFDPAAPSYRIFTEPATTASEVREGRCAELEALGLVR
ncbi:MAG TPA: carboxylesterase family protein [Polyangiaceae bacterium LLY-WYZ-15_(1-7)]|nr:carboxylesterase [Sandaracinus sp.]HJL00411.1 carboxylesterase family protein [Polyangiaceae bacterium LLY-WYZ-15_(1-7)]HJL11006.1 carboxylesterase family protein [Polyangiaceae bacterium LLY-WYZ-15_(1-7)]HJL23627.1 carboxylesterase family protein [Polyangiaceae bacterium LLY-WYZ-15_(1-7)]